MRPPKPVLLRNIILSFTIIIALSIVVIALISIGEALGLEKNSIHYDVIMEILIAVILLFSLIFFGSIIEFYGKEPGLLTIFVAYIFPSILAYYAGIFRDNLRTAVTILIFIIIFVYIFISEGKE